MDPCTFSDTIAPPNTRNPLQATHQSSESGRAANRFTSDMAGGWATRGKQPRNRGSTGAEPRLQRGPPPVWPVLVPPGSNSSVRRQLMHDTLLPGSGGSNVPDLVGMQRGSWGPFAWDVAQAQRPSLQGVVPQPWAKPHAVAQQPSLLAAQQQLREDQALMDVLAAEHHRDQVQHAQQQQEHLAEILARQHLLSQGSLGGGPALAAKGSAESLGRLQRQTAPSLAGASAQDSPGARLRLGLQDLRQMQSQHQVKTSWQCIALPAWHARGPTRSLQARSLYTYQLPFSAGSPWQLPLNAVDLPEGLLSRAATMRCGLWFEGGPPSAVLLVHSCETF